MFKKITLFSFALLAGCGGGETDSSPPTSLVSYTVSAKAGNGGSIDPLSRRVTSGDVTTFTVTADSGYRIANVSGCNGNLHDNTYTTGVINQACVVNASFESVTVARYTVNTSFGEGGTISPQSLEVEEGKKGSFTISPDDGYLVEKVSGCDGSMSGNIFTTGTIKQTCVVTASFKAINVSSYTVTAVAEGGGNISPASQLVDEGSVASFLVNANSGYKIAEVSGCEGSLQNDTYTTGTISEACTVTAKFDKKVVSQYTVTANSGDGGSISPASYIATEGEVVEFTVTPEEDHVLLSVTGCDGQLINNLYQTGPVIADCTIHAAFSPGTYALMPDPALRAAVLQQLGMPEGTEVTETLIRSLTYLAAPNRGIVNLTGLEHATNLIGLQLIRNKFQNVSPLSRLENLDYLNLSSNPISDFSPLAELAQYQKLRQLSLGGTALTDLSFLAEHHRLESLSIFNTPVTDLSAIAHLPLKIFEAGQTEIVDEELYHLQNMPLEVLDLMSTSVRSLDMLTGVNFRRLDLSYTAVSDITFLSGNTQLNALNIPRTLVTDFSPLLTTGLAENQGSLIYSENCIKTTGFSRALVVVNTLREAGVDARLEGYGPSFMPPIPCELVEVTISGEVSASLENQQLHLDWQVNVGDTGPYQCEVHTNLTHQLPRMPLATIENCHQKTSTVLSGFDLPEYDVHLMVDIGLPGGTQLLDASKVTSVDKPVTAILSSFDWLQTVIKTSPKLVAGKSAGLRLHVTSEQAVAVPMIKVIAHQSDHGSVTLPVVAPSIISQQKQHDSLTSSYLVEIPAELMRAGLNLDIVMDNVPVTTISPVFAEVNSIDLTLVPLQLGEIVSHVPESEEVEQHIKQIWPLATVNITRREPYRIIQPAQTNTSSSMLWELADLHEAENAQSYYYGYFEREMNSDGYAGMGYRPGLVAVGQSTDNNGNILQHELGHNFSLPHAPCGNAGNPDVAFPYVGGDIGSYGISLSLDKLFRPNQNKDVMGYCSPKFVSDYNYENAQNFLEQNKSKPYINLSSVHSAIEKPASDEVSSSKASWYIRGAITATNDVSIAQILAVDTRNYASTTSELQFRATLFNGQTKVVPAEIINLGHGQPDGVRYFKAYLPGQSYSKLELLVSGDVVFSQSANLLFELNVPPELSSQAYTTKTPQLTEYRNQVCVDMTGLALNSSTLLWVDREERIALALGEREPQFCRDTDGLPTTGAYELQIRKGLSVERMTFSRN